MTKSSPMATSSVTKHEMLLPTLWHLERLQTQTSFPWAPANQVDIILTPDSLELPVSVTKTENVLPTLQAPQH